MSPTLIKEFHNPPREGAAHGSTVRIPVNGHINLIEWAGELHVFFDARQPRSTRSLLEQFDGKKAPITHIECISDGRGRLYYEPSRNLINSLLSARELAVTINRRLKWNVHIGRKPYLHRRYIGREDKRPDLLKNIIVYP